jgi:GAF domain-containing protein
LLSAAPAQCEGRTVNESPLSIAAALTESAKTLHAPRSLEQSLDAIVTAARDTVPGFDHVGVSVTYGDGKIETMAGTDQLVWELDDLQYRNGQGPCVAAIESEGVVLVEHAHREQRWPKYIPAALKMGLRSQLGIRLYTDADGTLGGLNLYSTQNDAIDKDAVEIAELFATHAAIAFGRSKHEDGLNEALRTRKVIGQALGILSERYQIDEDRAFHFLVRASSTSNIKLRDIAQEIVDQNNAIHRAHVADS